MIRHFQDIRALIEPGRRRYWLGLVVLGILGGVVEAVGAGLVFLLLGLISGSSEITSPVLSELGVLASDRSDKEVFTIAGAIIIAFFLVRGALLLYQSYAQHKVAYRSGERLSSRLLGGYLTMPYEFHLRRNSAELIRNSRETVEVVIANTLVPTVHVGTEAMLVLGVMTALALAAPVATSVAVLVMSTVAFVLLRTVRPMLERFGAQSHRATMGSLKTAQEALQGIRDITLLGRQDFFRSRFNKSRHEWANANYLRATLHTFPHVVLETSFVLLIVGALIIVVRLGGDPAAGIPILGLGAYAAVRIVPAINKVLGSLYMIRFGRSSLTEILDALASIDALGGRPIGTPTPAVEFQTSIEFESVSYRYADKSEVGLTDISLSIGCGKSIGIVGPTGGGKSTLVDLLVGLLTPTSGSIRIDGADLQSNTSGWQTKLGLVSQSVFLIDDTLRRNVALGVEDDLIDESLVVQCLRVAQLESFVNSLPEELSTRVGERGVQLSGGERQRVAIARALYQEPEVLVLDEGTSSLDNVTERNFSDALHEHAGRRTLIIVAHRLGTVRDCDQIHLIVGGKVTDSGTYEHLITHNADFRRMAAASRA